MALDDCNECPLCMDPLEIDDINFYPCDCGYQICRFCWTRLINEENGLCPACRSPYNSEKPASFKPISNEELYKMKKEKKKKDQQKKCKSVVENRKHLSDYRVVQNNLIFIVGIPMRLANEVGLLSSNEYFGKYGKVYKIVVNHNNTFSGPQGQQCVSAYVTYRRTEDAMRAVLDLNKREIDGRQLKVSLGTTKYCSQFLRGVQCTKPECMYLHELGEDEASFTKEDMQQGKHTEYEQHLIASYLATVVDSLEVTAVGGGPGDTSSTCAAAAVISKPRHESFSVSSSQAVLSSREQHRKRQTSLTSQPQLPPHPLPPPPSSIGAMGDLALSLVEPSLRQNGVIHLPSGVHLECSSPGGDYSGVGWSEDASCVAALPSWGLSFDAAAAAMIRDDLANTNVNTGGTAASSSPEDEDVASYDFDPFRESQEGLAEMMETERCLYQQYLASQHQQPRHHPTNSFPSNSHNPGPPPGYEMFLAARAATSSSLPHHYHQQQHRFPGSSPPFSSSQDLHHHHLQQQHQQPHQHQQPTHLLPFPQPPSGGSGNSQSSSYSALSDFPNSIRHPDELNMREFHQALRSLLPHANISFGSVSQGIGGSSPSQQPPPPAAPSLPLSSGPLGPSHSWIMDDPAVVSSGDVSSPLSREELFKNGYANSSSIPMRDAHSHNHQNLWGSFPPGLDYSIHGTSPSQSLSLAGQNPSPIQSANGIRQRPQSNSFQL